MTFEEAIKKISKQDIEDVYIKQNNSRKETSNLLGISETMVARLMKYYDIHKSKELVYESARNTNKNKYGLDYARKRAEACKNTKLLKYGDANYNNAEKAKQTSLEKYGVTNPNKTKEVRDKIRTTCLKRYGATAAVNSDKYREHNKKVKLERYGSQNNHKKIVQTNLQKYGCEAPLQNQEIMERKNNTCIEKYGHSNVFANKEIQQKIQSTILEKYGVMYSCLAPHCWETNHANDSSYNLAFENLLKEAQIEYSREFVLEHYRYDFKVGNYLIEIDPFPTHNALWGWGKSEPHSINYHFDKTNVAEKYQFHCIHIFDWDDPKKIIDLIKPKQKIYARQCELKNIDAAEANKFLNLYHIQGKCNGNIINYGLFFKGELIELMTFGKPRYNTHYDWELLRLCSKSNYSIIGGASKLLSYFNKQFPNSSIVSYCDKSKFSGDVYKTLGFTLKVSNKPSKHWYNGSTHVHITDNLLRQRGFDQLFHTSYGKGTSNEELMIQNGFVPIYDCGQQTWELQNA